MGRPPQIRFPVSDRTTDIVESPVPIATDAPQQTAALFNHVGSALKERRDIQRSNADFRPYLGASAQVTGLLSL
jgi:hypothetical protein